MNEKVLSLLQQSKALIADPASWTKGAYAKTGDGRTCSESSIEAVAWCARGAINHCQVMGGFSYEDGLDAKLQLHISAYSLSSSNIFDVNDRLGHEAVMKMYEKSIQEVGLACGK